MQTTIPASGSIAIHGAILLGFVGVSLVHVAPLGEPAMKRLPVDPLILHIELPPAAAAPPPRAAGGSLPPAETIAPETSPDQVQPQEIPPGEIRREEAGGDDGMEDGIEGGHPEGVSGGIPGGVPGGDPDGALGGILGGVPHGAAGSPLHGLPVGDRPVRLTGEIRPPERITYVKPEYPEMARQARAEGKVILEIVVGRTGSIEEVTVLRSHPLFDQAAVAAVRRWKYRPALQAGMPVEVRMTLVVSFELQ